MEEELREKMSDCVRQICKEYEKVLMLLGRVSGTNAGLQQYRTHVLSILTYANTNYRNASSIDLVTCKRRHDPVRFLMEVESRFNEQEQGFYQLYPDKEFRTKLKSCFEATSMYYDILENCLSEIN